MTPVAGPFRAADGSAVRPLQKGDHAWMCHFDRVYETPNHDLHFAALEAAVGARDAARVPALVARVLGSDGGDRFDASCARPGDALRHALYRFNGVEPDRGRTCALALNESLQSQYAYAPAANVSIRGPGRARQIQMRHGEALPAARGGPAEVRAQGRAPGRARGQAAARRRDGGAARGGAHRQVREGIQAAGENTSTVRERAAYYRHEHRWRAKNNMSYCAAVDAAADAIASKTTRAAWVVVCTPPRCAPDQAEVAALTSRAAIPVVALTTLGGASTEMSGSGRSKKLRIVREYLMNEGRDLDVVVFSDATDVLANAGTLREVEEHLEGDQLLVAGDPSCWIGAVCDEVEAANLRRALPGHFENRGLFANSGQYVGSRTAVLRFVDWAVGQLDAKDVTTELANLLSPSRIAEMKAGRFEPSDQCLLHAYWASYPDRVRIDSNAAVFASFKRFYVLEADDRGVRTPGRQADGQGQAATLRWQPLAPAAWPKASPFSDKPLVACKELELPVKRFIDGPGYYCDDYDHVAGKFKWRCNQAGAARMLVYKGGANNTTQPLLGWHAVKSTSVRAPDNASRSRAMTWPRWLRRAVRNEHHHAIEQASTCHRAGDDR